MNDQNIIITILLLLVLIFVLYTIYGNNPSLHSCVKCNKYLNINNKRTWIKMGNRNMPACEKCAPLLSTKYGIDNEIKRQAINALSSYLTDKEMDCLFIAVANGKISVSTNDEKLAQKVANLLKVTSIQTRI